MDTPFLIGLIIFLLCAFGARFISERAMRSLPAEQKVKLIDAFSGMRMYGLLWTIGLLGAYFALPTLLPNAPMLSLSISLGLAVIFLVVRQVMVRKKLNALEVDAAYKRKVMMAQLLIGLGLVVFIGCVLAGVM